jgi:predicted dehydrogenase
MEKVKIGIIGCGNISAIYIKNCKTYDILDLVAVADLDIERAKARAAEFNISKAYSVEEILADPAIELIINLTIPAAHAEICLKALEAGKNVYVEKPLAVTREDGERVLELAKSKGLIVGSAPETFMGGGIQTCRKLIDDGQIGKPVAVSAFMMGKGHEHWHPDPEFFFQVGGGPMFDMGPYYLTALVSLLGPIRRISGSATISYPERIISSEPKKGTKIEVKTPTHVTGILEFTEGVVGTMIMSFDIMGGASLPPIELYGSEGTLKVPDPNTFGGPVMLRKKGETEWTEIPLTHEHVENSRGIGVADMAYALRNGREHRANGELAYHVLEAMHGFHDASREGKYYDMKSSCSRPTPLATGGIETQTV